MNKQLLCLAFFAMLLGSCQAELLNQKEEGGVTPSEIFAEVEPATKTFISVDSEGEGTIYWTPADEINIFYGTTSTHYTSQNTENATTAVFRTTDIIGSTESASDNIWGLYPYDENATSNGTSIFTSLPSAQQGVSETFDDDLFITLAHSTTNALKFYNVCGGIKFSLSRDDITAVTFRGNNNEDLAGDISLTFENDLPKASVVNGLKEITLTPKTGTAFASNVNYYLILLPGTLSGGFTMTFTASDGTIGTFNYSAKAITIKRSIFSKKAEMDTYATFVSSVTVPEAVDLGLPSGIKWASFNLGATKPEEVGSYFAWGELESKDRFSLDNYKWCEGSNETLTKYCWDSRYGYNGFTDQKLTLDLEDDAANYQWGEGWRMPTKTDCEELISNCTVQWTDNYCSTGVAGFLFTGKTINNSIFLPKTGFVYDNGVEYLDRTSMYRTSSVAVAPQDDFGPSCAYTMYDSNHSRPTPWMNWNRRYMGAAIRPVYAPVN